MSQLWIPGWWSCTQRTTPWGPQKLVGSISTSETTLLKTKAPSTSVRETRKAIRNSSTMKRLELRGQAPGILGPVKLHHGKEATHLVKKMRLGVTECGSSVPWHDWRKLCPPARANSLWVATGMATLGRGFFWRTEQREFLPDRLRSKSNGTRTKY